MISDQVILKPVYSYTETSLNIETLDVARLAIILFRKGITKALIRLCGFAGLSAPLLFTCSKVRFSSDEAYAVRQNVGL